MSINIIAAIGQNYELGTDNKLLWHLPNDLKRFKKLTENGFCVMGRKTYDSIGKPLSNRHNIILTRDKKYKAPLGTFVYHSFEEVITKYHNHNNNESDLWVIGGQSIYQQALLYAQKMYITIVHSEFKADTYFPQFNLSEWRINDIKYNQPDEYHPYTYAFVEYERKLN